MLRRNGLKINILRTFCGKACAFKKWHESVDIFYSSSKSHGFLSHVHNLCMDLSIEHMKISTGFSASQDTTGTVHSVNSNDRYRALVGAYPGLFAPGEVMAQLSRVGREATKRPRRCREHAVRRTPGQPAATPDSLPSALGSGERQIGTLLSDALSAPRCLGAGAR